MSLIVQFARCVHFMCERLSLLFLGRKRRASELSIFYGFSDLPRAPPPSFLWPRTPWSESCFDINNTTSSSTTTHKNKKTVAQAHQVEYQQKINVNDNIPTFALGVRIELSKRTHVKPRELPTRYQYRANGDAGLYAAVAEVTYQGIKSSLRVPCQPRNCSTIDDFNMFVWRLKSSSVLVL